MSLPTDSKEPVIPKIWEPVFQSYQLHDAWFSCDPNRLAMVYAGQTSDHWGKELAYDERITMITTGLSADISSFHANLLFSEPPKYNFEGTENEIKQVKERLDQIIRDNTFENKLLTGAETASALGGIYFKVNWNKDQFNFPIVSTVQPDSAFPEFTWGILTGVNFVKVISEDDNGKVYRLIERHEYGKIINALYLGDEDTWGDRLSLQAHPLTVDLEDEINTGYEGLLCRYVPNMLPNRRFRNFPYPVGQSDYAGSEGLLDSLDSVMSNWIQEIELAKARLIVPESFLESENGQLGFKRDRQIFTALDMDPVTAGQVGINSSQPDIRSQNFRETALELMVRIISNAGLSPQSFGLTIQGSADASGTALNIRERKSFTTAAKKQRYWKPIIEDLVEMMLFVDKTHLGNPTPILKPSVEMQDSIQNDMTQTSTALELLNRSMSTSIETRVKIMHPDWTQEQVNEEVEKIKVESGLAMPNPDEIGFD